MCASVCLNLCVCLVWKYSHSWLLIPLVFGAGVKTTVAQCKVSDPLLWFEHIFNSWYVVAVTARVSKKGSKGRVCTDLSSGVVVRFGGFLLHTTIPGKMSCSQKFQQNFQDWPSACFFYSFLRHFIAALWKKMTLRPGQCKMKQVEQQKIEHLATYCLRALVCIEWATAISNLFWTWSELCISAQARVIVWPCCEILNVLSSLQETFVLLHCIEYHWLESLGIKLNRKNISDKGHFTVLAHNQCTYYAALMLWKRNIKNYSSLVFLRLMSQFPDTELQSDKILQIYFRFLLHTVIVQMATSYITINLAF